MRKTGVFIMTSVCAVLVAALCVLLIVTDSNGSADTEFPTVPVNLIGQGQVLGNYGSTVWTNQTYMQFRGIPFAQSPSGSLRFKPPVPRTPWTEPFLATNYGKRCPVITTIAQLTPEQLTEDLEDCLNLCVYTKNLTAQQPVMFYVYGGGFTNGSSEDYPPQFLLEQDIVLVVPHYRVGALGWLTTYTEHAPGNVPIADILLALKWVQQYIHAFGGDSQQVTVFSQSAGASISSALLLSPQTPENSFKRLIVQSGSIFAAWAINRNPTAQALRICQTLGCAHCEILSALHDCVLNAPVKHLLKVTTTEVYSPVLHDLQGILPQYPNELLKQYKRNVPLMTGFTKHDGSFVLATYYDSLKKIVGNMSHVTVHQFAQGIMDMFNDTTGLSDQLLTRLLFSPQLLASNDHKTALPNYFDLTNIIFLKSPVISLATKVFSKQRASVYVYSFEYEGEQTRFGYEFGNEHYPFNGGVHHSNDNMYLFNTHKLNAHDTIMAQRMVSIWTSFAKYGRPVASVDANNNDDIQIPPLVNELGPFFRINKQISIADDLLDEITAILNDPERDKLDRPEIEF